MNVKQIGEKKKIGIVFHVCNFYEKITKYIAIIPKKEINYSNKKERANMAPKLF